MTARKVELFFWIFTASLLLSAAFSAKHDLMLLPFFASTAGLLTCWRWMAKQ